MKKTILNAISNYQAKGSGWYFDKVLSLEVHTSKYQPLKGSSYVKLPDKIAAKKAIINIQNKKDNKCFMWSISRYLYSEEKNKHPERIYDLKQHENG